MRPHGYKTVRKKKGKNSPKYPLSIFEGISQSILPNPPPKARETQRTSNNARNAFEDDPPELFYTERNFTDNKRQFSVRLTAFIDNNSLYLQSLSYFNGISRLLMIISESLKYEAFHLGV